MTDANDNGQKAAGRRPVGILNAIYEETARADRLHIDCRWLIEKIDMIHAALCPEQDGTWQERAVQAVRAAQKAAPSPARAACSTCRWWSENPVQTEPPMGEHLCLRSKHVSFGAYGQDGKAVITAPTFACNEYAPKTAADKHERTLSDEQR